MRSSGRPRTPSPIRTAPCRTRRGPPGRRPLAKGVAELRVIAVQENFGSQRDALLRARRRSDCSSDSRSHTMPRPEMRLLKECKLAKLVAPPKGSKVLEASGVIAKDGMFYVIFDNIRRVARIDPSLSPESKGHGWLG